MGSSVEALGHEVKKRRAALGLRQAELAELAGCSPRFLHSLENGKPTLRLDKVLDVLEVLGLDLLLAPSRGRIRTGGAAPFRPDGGVPG